MFTVKSGSTFYITMNLLYLNNLINIKPFTILNRK